MENKLVEYIENSKGHGNIVIGEEDKDTLLEALLFMKHLKEHKEVQEAPVSKGIPMCKICGKDSKKIFQEHLLG